MYKLKVICLILTAGLFIVSCKKEKTPPPPVTPPAVANYEDSIKNGLWAYFDFNNSNFGDLTGKKHNMTGANGAGFNYDMWGDDNNALELDGIDDYAVIDSGKLFPEGDFTVSFLMMPKSNKGRVFQKANFNNGLGASLGFGFDADLNSQGLHFYVSNNNNVCNAVTNASDASILAINKSMYQHAWYMVVIQYVKGVEKVYINGKLVATQTTPNQTFKNCNTAPFYLGMWWLQDRRHFAGKIDELRIYSRGLNDKEVRYLYDRLP